MSGLAVKVTIRGKDELSARLRTLGAKLAAFGARVGTISGRIGTPFKVAGRAIALPIRAITGATKRLASVVGTIAKPLGILGAASAGAAFGIYKLVSAQAATIDEGSKFARQIGLGYEALQELQFAADRQGVPLKEFNVAIRMFGKNVGDARSNIGGLAGFMKKLPRDFQASFKATKTTEEAFDLVATAMSRIEDPAKRAAFAAQFFGARGTKMARLVDGGVESIKALREEKRKYGVITEQAGRDAEVFVDKQANLKAALAGVAGTISGKLMPAFAPMLQRMADFVAKNREVIATRVAAFMERLGAAMKDVNWAAVGEGIASALEWAGRLSAKLLVIATDVIGGDLKGAWKTVAAAWEQDIMPVLRRLWEWIQQGFDKLLAELKKAWDQWDPVGDKLNKLWRIMPKPNVDIEMPTLTPAIPFEPRLGKPAPTAAPGAMRAVPSAAGATTSKVEITVKGLPPGATVSQTETRGPGKVFVHADTGARRVGAA